MQPRVVAAVSVQGGDCSVTLKTGAAHSIASSCEFGGGVGFGGSRRRAELCFSLLQCAQAELQHRLTDRCTSAPGLHSCFLLRSCFSVCEPRHRYLHHNTTCTVCRHVRACCCFEMFSAPAAALTHATKLCTSFPNFKRGTCYCWLSACAACVTNICGARL